MRPYFGSGFGQFSHIMGPWTDFFPSSGGAGLDTSQFGLALGTKITGSGKGATITKIIADPPFNIAGSQSANNWRLLVLRGDLDERRLWNALDNDFQLATNGWPRKAGSDLQLPVMFEKIIQNKTAVNAYGSSVSQNEASEWDLGDEGPSVGSDETMTVIFTPLFNATGVPGYGAANSTFAALTVLGKYDRLLSVVGGERSTGRSIRRGQISGI